MQSGFTAGEASWRTRLGTLRQVVRQELVTRQLTAHLPAAPSARVLDAGCGQGTQLLALARAGHQVTGVDASATLLTDLETALAAEAPQVRARVQLVQGDVTGLGGLVAAGEFDAVLCHGVLMYLDDPGPLLSGLTAAARSGGLLSLLVRNGDALALRPGLSGDWPTALRAFDDLSYGNRIGVTARADRRADVTAALAERAVSVENWYGVRVFTDLAPADAPLPPDPEFRALLACELRAGSTDPYRAVAALTHFIARKSI